LQNSSNQYVAHKTGRKILWIIHKILWGVGGGSPAHASVFGGLPPSAFGLCFQRFWERNNCEKIIVGSIWDLWYREASYVSLF
jgi:hypothetical protein